MLYQNLLGKVSPDAPFVPISDELMEMYLAIIEQQHPGDPMDGGNNTMNA